MSRPTWPPPVLIFEGPDGCGKTEIAKAFAEHPGYSYFKVSTERENWKNDTFSKSLYFDSLLPQFVEKAVPCGNCVIMDRGYPSEWVYSIVFDRTTDDELLEQTDKEFARVGAMVVLLLRRDYSQNRDDDLIARESLIRIHDVYVDFMTWTRCPVVTMYVGDYNDDVNTQVPELRRRLFATYENQLEKWKATRG